MGVKLFLDFIEVVDVDDDGVLNANFGVTNISTKLNFPIESVRYPLFFSTNSLVWQDIMKGDRVVY